MDEVALQRIEKYKKAGWVINPDDEAVCGIGYISSPSGSCFSYSEIRLNRGLPPWEVWRPEEIKECKRFGKLYQLIGRYYRSLYIERGLDKLFS